MIIEVEDFDSGKYELHTGMYEQVNIQEYIDRYEKKYIIDLLGATLGNDFYANCQANPPSYAPTDPLYLEIFNPIEFDYGIELITSEGMRDMLTGFIYYEYLKDKVSQVTSVGMVTPKGENSENVSTLFTMMYNRYNEACRSYKGVQRYIGTKSGDFSDFNGRVKQFITWL